MGKRFVRFVSSFLCITLLILLIPSYASAVSMLPPDGGGPVVPVVPDAPVAPVDISLYVSFNSNGSTEGSVPASAIYAVGAAVTVPGNTGSLVKTGFVFSGWNTNSDGSGTQYYAGSTFVMPGNSVVLYANWVKNDIVFDQSKWPIQDSNYNVAYSTTDGKSSIVPTSYKKGNVILYKTPEPGTYAAKYNFVGFSDVSDTYWARQFVWFLSARSVIDGKTKELYAPEDNITRAEFIKVLACITPDFDAGESPAAPVSDVLPSDWFSPYVNWGIANKIDAGDNGLFRPKDAITREEMCLMIANYTAYIGYNLGSLNPPMTFDDQSAISSWAVSSVSALQQSGLITGSDNKFNPQGVSSRAQAATIISRLLMGILDAMDNPSVIPAS